MSQKAKSPDEQGRDVLKIDPLDHRGVDYERAKAEVAQSASHGNALTARRYAQGWFGELGLMESIDAMRLKAERVQAGDMSGMESLLVAQATALDAIFTELARRAALNMGEYLSASERDMRLALKAQSQCRTTVEALAQLKNPRPVAFVHQANIAHGPQQVNNARSPSEPLSRENPTNETNEPSGAASELLTNTRASTLKVGLDSKVEAMGKVHRAKD